MSLGDSIILGLVQGLAEWLPISSDGHLVLAEKFFAISSASLSYDIFLHLGSLLVIVIFFRREIKTILYDLRSGSSGDQSRKNWFWYIILSSAVTALLGWLLYDQVKELRQVDWVANFLLITSAFVLAAKFAPIRERKVNIPIALVLGLAQGLAVLPGLSRSGLVIASALLLGLNKKDAFEYGFILVIPAIIGAFILSVRELVWEPLLLVGLLITIVVSYFTLHWLRWLIKKEYFYLFSFYTLILALIIKLF